MEIDIDPVYVKGDDINIRGNVLIKLCNSIHKNYPGEVYGAQPLNNAWLIYVRSNKTRAALIVNGITIEGVHIPIYDDKPQLQGGKRSERVVIKDLPATLPPDRILSFLKGYPHIVPRSRVLYAKERMGGEEMSPYINGDRLIYIRPDVNPPLPKETVIGGHPCRIWHPSQKNFCKRCEKHGHRTIDDDMCPSYEPDCVVAAWRADNNPLSNFYKCALTFESLVFKSSEHFYQYEFCMFMNRIDIAEAVFNAASPKLAKEAAAPLKSSEYTVLLAEWAKIKLAVMSFILRVKWNCCGKFRQALLQTTGMTIAEATSCTFWGVGVAPNLAQHTKPSTFLGLNHMGKLQMTLRQLVEQPANLSISGEIDLPPKPVYGSVDLDLSISVESSSEMPSNPSTSAPNVTDITTNDKHENIPETQSDVSPLNSPLIPTPTINNLSTEQAQPIHTDRAGPPEESSEDPSIQTRKPNQRRRGINTPAKSNMNTLDKYVTKDTVKRKPSGEAGSPSSVQVSKVTRTDGADTVI